MAGFAFGQPALGGESFFEKFHHASFLFHADHEVHAIELGDFARLQLCVASHHHDEGAGVLACESVDGLAAFRIGHIGDGAGIDDADICPFAFLRLLCAFSHQLVAQRGSFRKIQFAAQRTIGHLYIR